MTELLGDVLDFATTPVHTAKDATVHLVTGHPVDALGDLWDGTTSQVDNVAHVGEDVWEWATDW